MLALHFFCERQAHILNGHRVLLLVINVSEAESFHLCGISCIGREVKYAGPLATIQISLAVEAACISGNGEMHVLAPGLGDVHAGEGSAGPIRLVVRHAMIAVLDKPEVNLAGLIGVTHGPTAALGFGSPRRKGACNNSNTDRRDCDSSDHAMSPIALLCRKRC